jgi:diacylglycerol kinase family enzyme
VAPPTLGLLGGDLWRTLGAPEGGEARLASSDAHCFPVDLGLATIDGRDHCFVAHLVARSRAWRRAVVVMNASWLGDLNLGPRAHPNDGLLDVYEADLGWRALLQVRGRARQGAHLPHPRIRHRRVSADGLDFGRPLDVWLDGEHVGRATRMAIRIQPDALSVVV